MSDFVILNGVCQEYVGTDENVVIPEGVEILDLTFQNKKIIKSITIPSSVKEISIFDGDSGLEAVYITDLAAWCNINFQYILANPLYYAKNLYLNGEPVTDLVIPHGVTEIKRLAFCGCESIRSVTIPDGVTRIEVDAFCKCQNLTDIRIPDSIERLDLGQSVCENLQLTKYDKGYYLGNETNPYVVLVKATGKAITSCKIHPDTKIILDSAFRNCRKMKCIDLPEGIRSIGREAFRRCDGIREIHIPKSVSNIAIDAFASIDGLESIAVEDGNPVYHVKGNCLIDTKDKKVIAGCKGSIIPSDGSVTKIEICSFEFCRELLIPKCITRIDRECVAPFPYLESIVVEEGNEVYHAKGNCLIDTERKALILGCNNSTIPSDGSVTEIRGWAFFCCEGIKHLFLPKYITKIIGGMDCAFEGSTYSLESIVVEEGNPIYCSENNCLIEKERNILLLGCKNSVIPIDKDIRGILCGAFWHSDITEITIPSSVKWIEEGAFSHCKSLKSVVFESGSKCEEIGSFSTRFMEEWSAIGAFEGCVSLTDITLPQSMEKINYRTFADCKSLQNAVVLSPNTEIDKNAFKNCPDATVFAPKDSPAAKYAKSKKMPFVAISEEYIGKEFVFASGEETTIVDIRNGCFVTKRPDQEEEQVYDIKANIETMKPVYVRKQKTEEKKPPEIQIASEDYIGKRIQFINGEKATVVDVQGRCFMVLKDGQETAKMYDIRTCLADKTFSIL